VIEPLVVAIDLAGGAQGRACSVVTREHRDALERLRSFRPRTGTAIEPSESVVMIDIIGIALDDLLHRDELLEWLIEILVDIRELFEERGRDIGAILRGSRFIGEQQGELLPHPLLGGERPQSPPSLGIPRCMTHVDDRRSECM
jgi:hypothetical protein